MRAPADTSMLKGRSAEESAVLEAQKAGSRKSWPRAVIVISRVAAWPRVGGEPTGAGGGNPGAPRSSTARERGAAGVLPPTLAGSMAEREEADRFDRLSDEARRLEVPEFVLDNFTDVIASGNQTEAEAQEAELAIACVRRSFELLHNKRQAHVLEERLSAFTCAVVHALLSFPAHTQLQLVGSHWLGWFGDRDAALAAGATQEMLRKRTVAR